MLKLAQWSGLSYYLLKEENPSSHIVLVQDEAGKKALINLETGSLETGCQISNTLSFINVAKAQKMTRDFRDDFLDYWNEMKSAANGNL